MEDQSVPAVSRRQFLKATAAGSVGVGSLALGAPNVLGAASREFKIGVIGCGGRGTGAARDAMEAAKLQGDKATIVALADVFEDKADRARRAFKVDKKLTFTGFDAYKKLLEIDCDYVIVATPPHFRPEHFEAIVRAEKNVFTEKPVAVDAPGIRRFLAAGETAKANRLSVVAGTQRRHQKQYLEARQRVAEGAIGDIVAGRCYWNMGGLWSVDPDQKWTDMEWQIRDWLYFTWLSGDHIVEQHVHNLDVMNWFIGTHPISARGMGGRQVRTGRKKYGNVFDHFATELIYPSPLGARYPDIRVTSMCRQIDGCWNEVSEHLSGTLGSTDCKEHIRAEGSSAWTWSGKQVKAYVQEHIDLQADIKNADRNDGGGQLNEAQNVAYSTMTPILCRTSCYTGREIAWNDLMQDNERLGPEKYEFGPVEFPEVAAPGKPM